MKSWQETMRKQIKEISIAWLIGLGYTPPTYEAKHSQAYLDALIQLFEGEMENFVEQIKEIADRVPPNQLLNEIINLKWKTLSPQGSTSQEAGCNVAMTPLLNDNALNNSPAQSQGECKCDYRAWPYAHFKDCPNFPTEAEKEEK